MHKNPKQKKSDHGGSLMQVNRNLKLKFTCNYIDSQLVVLLKLKYILYQVRGVVFVAMVT